VPPPVDGGIAAYLGGIAQSDLAQEYDLQSFDVRVPPSAQRKRWRRPIASARFLIRFAGVLRTKRPDLVHIHTSAYMSFWEKSAMGTVASLQHIPWVLHLHDGFFETFLPGLRRPFATLALNSLQRAAAVIAPCQAWQSWLGDWVSPKRLHLVANGVDCAAFEPVEKTDADTMRLLFLGHLTPQKGIDDLAQALAALGPSEAQHVQLELVGNPPHANQLPRIRALFEAAGFEKRVQFLGNLYGADKLRALQRADVFILPSHQESFCIANVEAMAAGLPVISTRTGAIPEVIRDGVEGFLVAVRDPQKRRRMGIAARQRARDYDWSLISARIARIYEDVLQPVRTG
jgi:glycosyltransferase involved in cell wall biosynthesis